MLKAGVAALCSLGLICSLLLLPGGAGWEQDKPWKAANPTEVLRVDFVVSFYFLKEIQCPEKDVF